MRLAYLVNRVGLSNVMKQVEETLKGVSILVVDEHHAVLHRFESLILRENLKK